MLSIFTSLGVSAFPENLQNFYLTQVKDKLSDTFPGLKEKIASFATFLPRLVKKGDKSSELNALIDMSRRPVLMIDPMGLGKQFLRRKHPDLQCVYARDPQLSKILAESKGPLLVEKLGKELNDLRMFKSNNPLYLSTLLDDPAYPAEVFEHFTVVNLSEENEKILALKDFQTRSIIGSRLTEIIQKVEEKIDANKALIV
jgi:hypothetical protein